MDLESTRGIGAVNWGTIRRTLLGQIVNPPRNLFYLGDKQLLFTDCLAIVGTRKPSPYGIRAALSMARLLAQKQYTIVSGLARGIDGASHRGALKAEGRTIAVLAHGLDRVYPPEHQRLAGEILDGGGCILSEYPVGTVPLKGHFPARNRIISGLCCGVLVVEAGLNSGSLITAGHAADQGREVFVLPARFDDPSFLGGHKLIQSGAKLVTCLEDILEELPSKMTMSQPEVAKSCGAELRQAFCAWEGSLTLEQLVMCFKGGRSELFQQLEWALDQGIISEISPQQFVWVG